MDSDSPQQCVRFVSAPVVRAGPAEACRFALDDRVSPDRPQPARKELIREKVAAYGRCIVVLTANRTLILQPVKLLAAKSRAAAARRARQTSRLVARIASNGSGQSGCRS